LLLEKISQFDDATAILEKFRTVNLLLEKIKTKRYVLTKVKLNGSNAETEVPKKLLFGSTFDISKYLPSFFLNFWGNMKKAGNFELMNFKKLWKLNTCPAIFYADVHKKMLLFFAM
jgi:hypothetical protein